MSEPSAPAEKSSQPLWRYALWFLAGILVTVLCFIGIASLTKPPAPAPAEVPNYAQPDTLLRLQEATNQGLQEEIDRMKRLLERDVCLIGTSPLLQQGLSLPSGIPGAPNIPGNTPGATPPGQATAPGQSDTPKGPDGTPPAPNDGKGPENTPPAEGATSPKAVARLLEQGTVLIVSPGSDGISFGTGFFFAPGLIATNRHVVENSADGKLFVTNKALGGVIGGTIQVISQDVNRDYAIIKVNDPRAANITPLQFRTTVERTDHVSAWGFPGLLIENDPKYQALLQGDASAAPEVTYSEGVVSVVLQRSPPLVVHTADLSQGNSGGPLVNQSGQVVAINTLIQFNKESNRQASVSLESSDLISFIQANGLTPSVAQ